MNIGRTPSERRQGSGQGVKHRDHCCLPIAVSSILILNNGETSAEWRAPESVKFPDSLSLPKVYNSFKQKLDVDFRKYVILGACNPPLAYRALNTELEIGLLLPCNVTVYEEEGESVVSILNPIAMLSVANNPGLDPTAPEARERLQRVAAALSA